MKVRALDHGLDLLGAVPAGTDPTSTRSPGLHLSTLYNRLYAELEPARYADDGSGPNVEKMALGLRFEEALERQLALAYFGERPPEQVTMHDPACPRAGTVPVAGLICECGAGIAYSPDGYFEQDDVLGEFKCTWQSSRKYGDTALSSKADKWVTQMKAYALHLGTTRARLFIFFVNGDYTQPYTPELRAWDIEFTARELTDNWRLLVATGQRHDLIPRSVQHG